MNFYVYEHIRPDTGVVFYVGKGRGDRKDVRRNRNFLWERVVNKASGFTPVIVASSLDEELAFLVEVERIAQLRSLGIKLCNLTDGGEGTAGFKGRVISLEHRQKVAEANRKRVHSAETRAKLSRGSIGVNIGRIRSEETRLKISLAKKGQRKGIPKSSETRLKMSIAAKGKIRSAKHSAAISAGLLARSKRLKDQKKD